MLKLYYNPISPNARRVWITLLEKDIPFEGVTMNLNGDQLQPEFLEINPFHHIPVLIDDGLRVVESLAIMDYLESKYPSPALLPQSPEMLAKVRMVQMITTNELFPQIVGLIDDNQELTKIAKIKDNINTICNFFTDLLGDKPYFGGEELSLADIVAGVAISALPYLEFNLQPYQKIYDWSARLMQRPAWQKTQLSMEDFDKFKGRVRVLLKLRRREMK
ncbi:glutathione S-transferase [Richelia sinica FACHB-800]|uniref:Glutathione S-transferase n=1 Tax=Richelia sinica FACHB-800 TaxID=1357546 RepID=A0A975Y414_9NOST|nr:glutathione S-transferase family protein [Richelia sinica]MBD2663722.1 glutathione S-transferase family protein [Richelia sinica FACHB-800]QXE22708.1 glutathione S-transferase [Richelia sinica FACHB-800]